MSTLTVVRAVMREARGIDIDGRRLAPTPKADPIVGHFRHMQRDRLGFILRSFLDHGDVVRLHFVGMRAHLLLHPDHAEHVLQKNARHYTKRTRGYGHMREFLGDGLLTSEGSFWLRQRRIAQPAFHKKRIEGFAHTMVQCTNDLMRDWERIADRGGAIDAFAEMMRLTLRIAGLTLLSTDPSDQARVVGQALDVVNHAAHDRINSLFALPLWTPTPGIRRAVHAMQTLDRIVLAIIEERRRGGARREDLLQMLFEARDEETGEGMTDQQLRDEVMTMFLAGHETTANMMTWTLYLLSKAPEHARRVHEEAARVLGDRDATPEDLPKLEYAKRVLQESLRLYPPAWIIGRAPSEDDEVDGYRMPKGSLVFVSPWVTHRHPAFWEDPEGFDPDRWAPEKVAKMHRYQHFPFGGGPRMCIGAGFAMMEGHLLLSTLMRRFRLDLVPGHRVEPEPLITLRPRFGVRMTVHHA